VDKNLIGEVVFEKSTKLNFNKIKKTLFKGKYKSIKLEHVGDFLIALANGDLVFGVSFSLMLIEENFKEIRKVTVGNVDSCALNHRNEIYVSNGCGKVTTLLVRT
jgi:hypothetical protein